MIRIPYVYRVYTSNNPTRDFSAVGLWTLAEMSCGFVILCVPESAVVLKRIQISSIFTAVKSWLSSLSSRSVVRKLQSSTLDSLLELKNSHHQINPPSAAHYQPDGPTIPGPSANYGSSIHQTVELMQVYDEPTADDQHGRQHPWDYKPEEPQYQV